MRNQAIYKLINRIETFQKIAIKKFAEFDGNNFVEKLQEIVNSSNEIQKRKDILSQLATIVILAQNFYSKKTGLSKLNNALTDFFESNLESETEYELFEEEVGEDTADEIFLLINDAMQELSKLPEPDENVDDALSEEIEEDLEEIQKNTAEKATAPLGYGKTIDERDLSGGEDKKQKGYLVRGPSGRLKLKERDESYQETNSEKNQRLAQKAIRNFAEQSPKQYNEFFGSENPLQYIEDHPELKENFPGIFDDIKQQDSKGMLYTKENPNKLYLISLWNSRKTKHSKLKNPEFKKEFNEVSKKIRLLKEDRLQRQNEKLLDDLGKDGTKDERSLLLTNLKLKINESKLAVHKYIKSKEEKDLLKKLNSLNLEKLSNEELNMFLFQLREFSQKRKDKTKSNIELVKKERFEKVKDLLDQPDLEKLKLANAVISKTKDLIDKTNSFLRIGGDIHKDSLYKYLQFLLRTNSEFIAHIKEEHEAYVRKNKEKLNNLINIRNQKFTAILEENKDFKLLVEIKQKQNEIVTNLRKMFSYISDSIVGEGKGAAKPPTHAELTNSIIKFKQWTNLWKELSNPSGEFAITNIRNIIDKCLDIIKLIEPERLTEEDVEYYRKPQTKLIIDELMEETDVAEQARKIRELEKAISSLPKHQQEIARKQLKNREEELKEETIEDKKAPEPKQPEPKQEAPSKNKNELTPELLRAKLSNVEKFKKSGFSASLAIKALNKALDVVRDYVKSYEDSAESISQDDYDLIKSLNEFDKTIKGLVEYHIQLEEYQIDICVQLLQVVNVFGQKVFI